MENNFKSIEQTEDSSDRQINLKDQIAKYIYHWKWFVLSAIICLFGTYFYLRYATPEYKMEATILIKDDKKEGLHLNYQLFLIFSAR
ncbi:Wzz/FepE/Etk N-terminal domain-containing protein [Flavobacterium sp. 3HN19-14]|uniref:Wzz/FepE/Etk N-terminal domain-containing protein n=1 Tax=Flavobacterium sp. 3HN19-14 TaxID=3448133 RepID=UPI003EE2390B